MMTEEEARQKFCSQSFVPGDTATSIPAYRAEISMSRGDYTVEVYKADKRTRNGERLVRKQDHVDADLDLLRETYFRTWTARDGYRHELHETYVTRVNLMSGVRFRERYDTPHAVSPSSETYWNR